MFEPSLDAQASEALEHEESAELALVLHLEAAVFLLSMLEDPSIEKGYEGVPERVEAQRCEVKLLETRLSEQRQRVASLRHEIDQLREGCAPENTEISEDQLSANARQSIARLHGLRQSNKLLSKSLDLAFHGRKTINKMERKVIDREERAQEHHSYHEHHELVVFELNLIAKIQRVSKSIEQLQDSLHAFDPNMQRAHRRFHRQLSSAREIAAESLSKEEELVKTFENLVSEGRTLLSIDDPSVAQRARLRFLEHDLPKLSESISRTRRTNYLNDQSLFQIHNVAIRLDVVLILMSGLPEVPNQFFSECSYFFRSMHRHLCSLEFGVTAYEDIHARLCALEKQTVKGFIKIIKGDANICGLAKTSVPETWHRITISLVALEQEQKTECSRWKELWKNSVLEEKHFLADVAKRRLKESAITLKAIERSIEALSLATLACERASHQRSDA